MSTDAHGPHEGTSHPATAPFPPLHNDLIIRAALGQRVERVPVWVMRQAGRYLPEFREVREKHDFFTVCRTPELACQVTLQPIDRFDLDAAIIFSDILVVIQALGLPVEMQPGKGPHLPKPLTSPTDLPGLNWSPNIRTELGYVLDAIRLTRHRLNGRVPLIGFAGAPWTLMTYMIEGGASTGNTQSKAKRWLYAEPEASRRLLDLLTETVIAFLVEQARAGAQLLQVFESHAGCLSPDQFNTFALPCLRRIAAGVHAELDRLGHPETVPLILFPKDAHFALDDLLVDGAGGYQVISIDWTIKPIHARRLATSSEVNLTLQGNLDPCALYAPDGDLVEMTRRMLEKFGPQRYIANLGHGIYPDVDPAKVKVFVDAVHTISEDLIGSVE